VRERAVLCLACLSPHSLECNLGLFVDLIADTTFGTSERREEEREVEMMNNTQ
jgi:hypothetical protein